LYPKEEKKDMPSSKPLFLGVLIALLISACGGGTPGESTEMDHIAMRAETNTTYGPVYIAAAEGFFEEQGIEVEFVSFNRDEGLPLIVTGDLDVYPSAMSSGLLNVLSQEDHVKVVADRGHIAPGECTYYGILLRKELYESGEVSSPADLTGRAVGSSPAGLSGFVFSTFLAQGGLTLEDLDLVDIPSVGMFDAFANGTLDADVTSEPRLSQLLEDGNVVLWGDAADVVGYLQLSVMTFGKRLLVDEPELGVRFMTAYLKGIQQYNEGKTERNLEIMAEATGESIEILERACWLPIASDGSVEFSGIDAFQNWSISQGHLDQAITEEQFWDPSVTSQARENLK
jgi:NitT/TauT family transport system substrate-binding protein